MFRLEITADTLQQFYQDAVNSLLLLTRGGQNLGAEQPQGDTGEKADADTAAKANTEATPGSEAVVTAGANPSVAPTPPPKKERKQRAAPVTIEVKAEPVVAVEKVPTIVDEDPLGLDTPAPKPEAQPVLALADMRQRVQDIITAHGPKTDKNPTARGNEMGVVVPYVRKLFAPFGIKLAAELKPDQFAEFWKASQAYLDGTAA